MNEKNLVAMMQKSFAVRGKLISDIIYLERSIDEYLARYFCDDADKRTDLMKTILCTRKITLDNKKEVFLFLLKKVNPDWLLKYPTVNADLNDLIEERNRFAHYILNSNETNVDNYTGDFELINFKNNIEIKPYNDIRISELEIKIEKYIKAINELLLP